MLWRKTFSPSKCDFCRLFHTERSWHAYRFTAFTLFLVGMNCPLMQAHFLWPLLKCKALHCTGSPSSLHERGRDSCLQAVLCYKRLFTKACMGCKRFFLKERKNVMFLNKIDVPYCLVVFFVVYPRLRPFWSVFGELALFWCSTAKRKTRQNSDWPSVRRSRRIIPLENYPRPQFLQKFKAEMLKFHVHPLDSQFLPQIIH